MTISSPPRPGSPLVASAAAPHARGDDNDRLSVVEMGDLSGATAPLDSPVWSHDGRWLAAPSHGGNVAIWDMADLSLGELSLFSIYARIVESDHPATPAMAPVCLPEPGFAFSAGERLYAVAVDRADTPALLGAQANDIIALTSNRRYVAALGSEAVTLWDLQASGDDDTETIALDRQRCRDLVWSVSADLVAVAGAGGVSVFDPTGTRAMTRLDIDDTACSVAWNADGTTLAAGGMGGAVYLWQRGERKPIRTLGGHLAPVAGISFSPDGRLLASASACGDIRLWNVRDGQKRHEIPEEPNAFGRDPWTGLGFNPGTNLLATIDSYDQLTVRLWSIRRGSEELRPVAKSTPPRGLKRPPAATEAARAQLTADPKRATPSGNPPAARSGGLRWNHASSLIIDEGKVPREPHAGAGPEPAALAPQRAERRRPPRPSAPRHLRAPLPRGPIDMIADELARHVAQTGLQLPLRVYEQTVAALNAGKHVLYLGPPGTGKTALARSVAEFAAQLGKCGAPLCTAVNAEWTTRDTIGGEIPHSDQGLGFYPGIILRAMNTGRWLVLDAVDRADTDRVFGNLLTVMSGHVVELPYQVAGMPVRLLPHRGAESEFTGSLPGDLGAYVIHPNWRMLATMNLTGQGSRFPLSPGLVRHFAVVDVTPPDAEAFRRLTTTWLSDSDGLPSAQRAPLQRALDRLLAPKGALMRRRPLGPALVRDMLSYVAERARTSLPDSGEEIVALLAEAFLLYAASQLEGLGQDDLLAIRRHLATVFADPDACAAFDARLRALHPEIPAGAWVD